MSEMFNHFPKPLQQKHKRVSYQSLVSHGLGYKMTETINQPISVNRYIVFNRYIIAMSNNECYNYSEAINPLLLLCLTSTYALTINKCVYRDM